MSMPLQPIGSGHIVIVGAKASNFDDELKNHPQVIMWSSQQENWSNKELPANTRAVFMTRWLSHVAATRIIKDARNRHITIFNPMGTGIIARQVKELLNMTPPHSEVVNPVRKLEESPKKYQHNKLRPLHQFIDFSKTNLENAHFLTVKGQELGITSTIDSLANMVGVLRKRRAQTNPATPAVKVTHTVNQDISLELFDNAVKDLRDFFIKTVEENRKLKARIEKFQKLFTED